MYSSCNAGYKFPIKLIRTLRLPFPFSPQTYQKPDALHWEVTVFIRIISGKVRPGSWSEFQRAYLHAVADAGAIEGLAGRWLTQDADDPDSGTTISLWATREALEAYEKSDVLRDKINARLSPFFVGEYRTSKSKVLFAEGDPAPSEWGGSDS